MCRSHWQKIMCRVKTRLIKSKNSMVDGAFDPFFKWFKKTLKTYTYSRWNLWKFVQKILWLASCRIFFLGPTIKKLTPLLLTYLFLFVYVMYEILLLWNFVECVICACTNSFDFFCAVELLFFSKVHQKTFSPSYRGSKMVCGKRTKFGNTKNYATGGTIIH